MPSLWLIKTCWENIAAIFHTLNLLLPLGKNATAKLILENFIQIFVGSVFVLVTLADLVGIARFSFK